METKQVLDAFAAGLRKAIAAVDVDDDTVRKATIDAALDEVRTAQAALIEPTSKGKKKKAPAADDAEDAADGADDESMEKAFIEVTETLVELRKTADDATARVKKAEETSATAVARVEVLEKERQAERIRKEAVELTSNMGGEVDNVVKTLTALDGNKEARDAYVATLKASNSAALSAALTKSLGFSSPAQVTAKQKHEAAAAELKKADPKLTDAQAMEKALDEETYLASLAKGSGTGAATVQ